MIPVTYLTVLQTSKNMVCVHDSITLPCKTAVPTAVPLADPTRGVVREVSDLGAVDCGADRGRRRGRLPGLPPGGVSNAASGKQKNREHEFSEIITSTNQGYSLGGDIKNLL